MRFDNISIRKQSWKGQGDIITYKVEIDVIAQDLIKLIETLTDINSMRDEYADLDTKASKEVAQLREQLRVIKINHSEIFKEEKDKDEGK